MPFSSGLIANRWKGAPKAHCRTYPLALSNIQNLSVEGVGKSRFLWIFPKNKGINPKIHITPCLAWSTFPFNAPASNAAKSKVIKISVLINWDQGRMTVTSPKTERYKGKGSRVVPIFGELKPYLQEAFDHAQPGAVYCIERYRYRNSRNNLRTQAHRIIRNAGLKSWTRTFQNLRASRETELSESFPMKSVTEWIGHSPTIANRHYLSVPDSHYEKACALCVQQLSAKGENEGKTEVSENQEIVIIPMFNTSYNSLQKTRKADGGNRTHNLSFTKAVLYR